MVAGVQAITSRQRPSSSRTGPQILLSRSSITARPVKPSSSLTAPDKATRCSGATRFGAGLDWALTPNIFARGEFEFVQFAPISNIVWPAAASAPGSNSEALLKRACFQGGRGLPATFLQRAHASGRLTKSLSFLSCTRGTPLPNEGRLSGRIDHDDSDALRA